jgi:hypothetical protein
MLVAKNAMNDSVVGQIAVSFGNKSYHPMKCQLNHIDKSEKNVFMMQSLSVEVVCNRPSYANMRHIYGHISRALPHRP